MNSALCSILLLAIAGAAACAIVSHPLRRHKPSVNRPTANVHRAERLQKTGSPLKDQNLEDNYYTVDILVGTPGQAFTVAIGTNFSSLVLQSKKCVVCAAPHLGTNYTARLFDETKSSTFKSGPQWSNNLDHENEGKMGYDTVNIASLQVSVQEFALAEQDYIDLYPRQEDLGDYPVDGILGLSWPSGAIDGATPFFQKVAKQLDAPVFSIFLGPYVDYKQNKLDGQITFGGRNQENCVADGYRYFPVTVDGTWIVELNGFQIGSKVSKMKHQALFDTQQSKMRTPGWEFDRIVAASGAEFDYDSLSYVVDCKKIPTLPKIRVSLGSTNMNYFEVSPEQYIVKNYGGYGKCVLDVEEQANGGWEPNWVFGGPFLRSYCQAYDFGQKRIGLSLAKGQS
ncbi:CRE-ASP-1 protein [Aphelenchoides avenae]|nr:CRE-ASP-1 protein [Aphelenchus avenae]